MRIGLRQDQRHVVLDVQREDGVYRVRDKNSEQVVHARLVERDVLLVDIEGVQHLIRFVRRNDTFILSIGGETHSLTRESPSSSHGDSAPVASPEIVAPMPGRVVQIMVEPGDAIDAGDTLLILEAMKMENRLLAEAAGIVDIVKVRSGDLVDGGQVLLVIKYEENDGTEGA